MGISVLKKIGIVMVDAAADVTKVMGLPFISALLGAIPGKLGADIRTGVGDMNTFASIVGAAEIMFPSIEGAKTGSAKLAAAAPLMQKEMLLWAQSGLPGHNKLVVPPEQFAQACEEFTQATANVLNCFGE
jgi:hypothetical protein